MTEQPRYNANAATFGNGYGAIQGILAALKIRGELIPLQTWKRVLLQGTANKDAAIAYCHPAFANVPLVLPRCHKPLDDLADALGLLEDGRQCLV
jgi:hypothetical protein